MVSSPRPDLWSENVNELQESADCPLRDVRCRFLRIRHRTAAAARTGRRPCVPTGTSLCSRLVLDRLLRFGHGAYVTTTVTLYLPGRCARIAVTPVKPRGTRIGRRPTRQGPGPASCTGARPPLRLETAPRSWRTPARGGPPESTPTHGGLLSSSRCSERYRCTIPSKPACFGCYPKGWRSGAADERRSPASFDTAGASECREVLDVSVRDTRNAWRRSPVGQAAVNTTVLLTHQAHSVPELTLVRVIGVELHMESAPHSGDNDPVGGSASCPR
jgi:hypothetical protein